ncbi:MAG: SH3 domain-containing protein [Bacillota bacterium]|nr:SH3 domain-containing protein [Bacillota bacterium]
MERAIMIKRAQKHKKKGSVVQKAILPSVCFAALSTIAFQKEIFAAQNTQIQMTVDGTQKYVNVNSGTLNLRSSPSMGASIIATLTKGTVVTVYSDANGWAKISANGKDGYVNSSFLSATNPNASGTTSSAVTSTTKYVNISSGTLNLRSSASTGASIITTLTKGTAVTVYSEANGWAKVNANGKDGYVSSSFLSNSNPNNTGNSSTVNQTTAAETISTPATKYVNVTSGSLNVRNSPSASASIIVKLAKGTSVQVNSEANGWAKIVVYGQTGYVSSDFLSDSDQSSPKSTATAVQQTVTEYVKVSSGSLNLRLSNSASSAVLANLANSTEVQVLSSSNGWAKIQVNGQTGYVSTDYLSESKPNNTSTQQEQQVVTKYVNVSLGSSLNMRKSPSVNSSIIVKIARGVEVTVLSEANGWANIEAYGQTGYVSTDYLSTTITNGGTDTSNNNGATVPTSADNGGTDLTTGNSTGTTTSNSINKYVNVIYGSSLNMRSSAATSSSIITKLARGTVVSIISEENGWSRITVNGVEGYVSSQYLSSTEPFDPSQTNSSSDTAYESYGVSLSDMVKLQMEADPQTDKNYNTYIRADALTLTSTASGTVKGSGWNVRGGAGTNFWVVGQVSNSASVQILSKVEGTDGNDWYQITYDKTWVNASPDDVTYYLDPNNFVSSSVDSYQFLKLSVTANLDSTEVNNRILNGKGILQGQAAAFISAGTTCGVNEIYLISHALLETGNGTSKLANGVVINGKTVYNMYGIGAYDADPINSGAQYAYNAGWFTPEDAIIGGAQFIAKGYINAGQDTLYKMRWNPSSAVTNGYATHQYATDIGWASKQVNQIYNLYQLLNSYKLVLDIPKYQ